MPQFELPQCFLCGKLFRGGFPDAIKIGQYLICENCEQKIVKMTVDDSCYYDVVERLKKMW